jgi:hypothetical protein
MYYGYPPPPGYVAPYHAPYQQPPQPSPEDLVNLLVGYKKAAKDIEELLKKPKEEKKPTLVTPQTMLAWMAIGAIPIGFVQIGIFYIIVSSVGKTFGLIP